MKNYCMSHYLAFRFIKDENINFAPNLTHTVYKKRDKSELVPIKTANDLSILIKEKISQFFIPDKTAIFLSGGIDSAILASYLPKGTKAYTFKCNAENAIDETKQARKYCEIYSLNHEIIEMNWQDFEDLMPEILRFNKVPFHSIEVQLVKAAKLAKRQGIERLIIGENSDLVFGGMDGLLAKDWDFDEFYARYNFIEPKDALKDFINVKDVYESYRLANNKIDFMRFIDEIFAIESSTSYLHAFTKERIKYLDPYSFAFLAEPLNLHRVRNGEPKYIVRELFAKRYPNLPIPHKIPMPRAMEQWLKNYNIKRPEFVPNCTSAMSGDQKWQMYCLETFLNMLELGSL